MNDSLIYDVGMFMGEDTEYYLSQGYDVIAVEANPVHVEANKIKFSKEISEGRLIIEHLGINDYEGSSVFYINKAIPEWSSFFRDVGCRAPDWPRNTVKDEKWSDQIIVKHSRLKPLFEKYGVPLYLKIDVEGKDFVCIEDLKDLQERPKYISLETFDDTHLEYLQSIGYNLFKLVAQGKHGEGFNRHSSGPFGEEAVDVESGKDWCHVEEIPQKRDKHRLWSDLHAKRCV